MGKYTIANAATICSVKPYLVEYAIQCGELRPSGKGLKVRLTLEALIQWKPDRETEIRKEAATVDGKIKEAKMKRLLKKTFVPSVDDQGLWAMKGPDAWIEARANRLASLEAEASR